MGFRAWGITLLGAALVGGAITAAVSGNQEITPVRHVGLPEDWSHRHVVFSNPTTLEQALRVRQEPRFWQQWLRRNVHKAVPIAPTVEFLGGAEKWDDAEGDRFGWFRWRWRRIPRPRNTLKRDWAESLGPGATVGAGNSPAKFSFDINTANCGSAPTPDFVVYNTSVSGSATQASIVAYDNLYKVGCSGTVPTTYWAYNTGGAVMTSVVLSLDGSQIMFVQTSSGVASLGLLKWKVSTSGTTTSTNPDSITTVLPAQYATCTAPCMTTLAFVGGHNDTNSSPYYDYGNDALYVGDDNGSLHKFQPVLSGTPAEVGGSWPVALASGLILSSPVFDSLSGKVFVGSGFNGSGAQLFAVNATTAVVAGTSSQLGTGNGILSGPIVDSSVGKVYAFVGTDNGTNGCLFSGSSCSAVYQFPTSFTSGSGRKAVVSTQGNAGAVFSLYAGTFDNAYYTSPNGTGNLYVCGNTHGDATLVQVPITTGTMSTSATLGLQIAGASGMAGNIPCSPLTEVFNPNVNSGTNSGGPQGTDRIFVGTQGTATTNPCFTGNGGCVLDFSATAWQANTAYAVGQVIADTSMRTQVVTTAGTSGAIQPNWAFTAGATTSDGTVTWRTKASVGTSKIMLTWTALTGEGQGLLILDSNGNLEATTTPFGGLTGAFQPTWSQTIGGTTLDGTEIWVNVGPLDTFSLPVLGGTSGIVVDNTVPTGTLGGGSQIYFSPLSNGFSSCGAGNGCAVQASQAGLN